MAERGELRLHAAQRLRHVEFLLSTLLFLSVICFVWLLRHCNFIYIARSSVFGYCPLRLGLRQRGFSRWHIPPYHIHGLIRLIPTRLYRTPTSDPSDLNDPICLIATTILLCRTRSVPEGAPVLVKNLKGLHHSVGRFLTGMIRTRETLVWVPGRLTMMDQGSMELRHRGGRCLLGRLEERHQ